MLVFTYSSQSRKQWFKVLNYNDFIVSKGDTEITQLCSWALLCWPNKGAGQQLRSHRQLLRAQHPQIPFLDTTSSRVLQDEHVAKSCNYGAERAEEPMFLAALSNGMQRHLFIFSILPPMNHFQQKHTYEEMEKTYAASQIWMKLFGLQYSRILNHITRMDLPLQLFIFAHLCTS